MQIEWNSALVGFSEAVSDDTQVTCGTDTGQDDDKHQRRAAALRGRVRNARFYWVTTLSVLLCCALSNLLSLVLRFSDAPTHLVTQDTTMLRMRFPSVIVCPEVFFPDYKIEKLLENAIYPPGMTSHSIRPYIRQLSAFFSPDVPYSVEQLEKVIEFLDYNDLDVEQAGTLLTTSCEETLLRCRFLQQDYDCLDIFHMEITMYGFCCTFNGRSLKRDIKLGGDKLKKLRLWYSNKVGPYHSLLIAVNQSQHVDNLDLTYKWLTVQKSRRYVDGTNNGSAMSPGTEMWVSFQTKYLEVTEDSRFMGDSLRGCFIETKSLKFFKDYNKKNCILECKVSNLLKTCRCLLPAHYRLPGVPLCDAMSLPCAQRALVVQMNKADCDCPLSCYYQTELLETNTYSVASEMTSVDEFYYGLNLSRVTVVRVFLKSHETTSFLRTPYYNFYDLFAQLGGVFNVFFGCSIISILELLQVAWYTLDPQSRKNRRRKKIHGFFFGLCCKARNGRVGKRMVKKVKFLKKCNKVGKSLKTSHLKEVKEVLGGRGKRQITSTVLPSPRNCLVPKIFMVKA